MNSNSNSNTMTPTEDWKHRIPEGNWRTPIQPQMQSATAWSYKTSMKEGSSRTRSSTPPPLPPHTHRGGVWSNKKTESPSYSMNPKNSSNNNRRNKNTMLITTPQAPIKKEFVYDMGDFPSLNPTLIGQDAPVYTTNKMSYANIASIPPPPQIPRNLNNDFAIEIHEYNDEEDEDYPEYEYETNGRKKWDDDEDDYDLESGSYN